MVTSKKEKKSSDTIKFLLLWESGFLLAGLLFYRSCLGLPAGILFFHTGNELRKRELLARRKEEFRASLPDYFYIVSSAVSCGKSLPAGLMEADERMKNLYGEEKEIRTFSRKIAEGLRSGNIGAGEVITEIAKPYEIPELDVFSGVIRTAVETGGSLENALLKANGILTDRLEKERTIRSRLKEKQMEITILVSVPLVLLTVLQFSSGDYMDVLYETAFGRMVMTVCLSLILISVAWSRKLVKSV